MNRFIPFLFIFLFIFACKSDDDMSSTVTDNEPEDEPVTEVDTITPSGGEQYLTLDSDYIFDQEKLLTFYLNIPEALLAQIDADPAAEEYVEGTLIFEGDTISPVGMRYKGSIGGFVGCVSGSDWANPSGFKTCTKLSMKVKINWKGREERFYGLKKLQFHSQNLDDSHMRERLGYWLYQAMGVAAPRSVHARLMINGEYSGLYALTEQIDGRFTRYHFDDGSGNLYKEIWPLQANGQPHPEQGFLAALKTNEDENPTAEKIRNFAQAVKDANDNDLQAVIAEWMNIEEIISYAVVDRTIRNDDGAFHWYCGGFNCSPHNFYWYEEPTAGTMHLIPWDLDNAFENIISNANPVTPIADDWGEVSADCNPFSYGAFGFQQRSAACDKLTGGWASFTDDYEQLRIQFKEGPFNTSMVNNLLDSWEAQIRDAVIEADETHNDAISVAQWQSALNTLKAQLEHARNN